MFTASTDITSEKDRIISFSRERFFQNGFQSTTMDSISSELHISKKTIYKYFQSKDDLIDQILGKLMKFVIRNMNDIINSDSNAVEKLNNVANFFMSMAINIGFAWLEDLKRHSWKRWKRIEAFRRRMILKNFSLIVEQGKKEGLVIDRPNIILITTLISAIQGVINPDFFLKNNIKPTDGASVILEVVVGGMLTKKGRKLFKQIKSDS